MASTSRIFTRALRSAPSSQVSKTATMQRAAPNCFRSQARRGYSSGSFRTTNNSSYLWAAAAAAGALGVTGYLALRDKPFALPQADKPFQPTKIDYQEVYNAIATKLINEDDYDDGSYGPVVLRLGWHASGTYDASTHTGGSNGATMRFAPESTHGANLGLKNARDFLEPIKAHFLWITYSDLWTLAAACAVQEMGGPDIPWRPGRSDRDASWCTSDGRLPDGSKDQNHLRRIFGRMGFNDQEIVALAGAHALGRAHRDRSGFEGPWTFSPTMLTNEFYKLLLDGEWESRLWEGPKQFTDRGTKTLMMLPTDMAIVGDEKMRPWARKYADDQGAFFEDFSKAVVKLFELGVPFTTGEEARMVFSRSK